MNKMSVRGSGSRRLVCALRKTRADRKRAESRKLCPVQSFQGEVFSIDGDIDLNASGAEAFLIKPGMKEKGHAVSGDLL